MRRKTYKKVEVDFTGIAHKGLAVGRTEEGIVIFAKGAVPGDLAVVSLNRKRKGVWTGQTESIIKYSRHRVNPKCEHFGVCGGCSWQHLDYAEQIQQKEQLKIGKLDPLIIESILPCENIYNYRNKLEFTFSTFKWLTNEEIKSEKRFELIGALGFHRPETFDRIVDINQCHLQIEISDLIRNFIRSYALEHFISFYNIKQHTGILRNLIIRTNQIEESYVFRRSACDMQTRNLYQVFASLAYRIRDNAPLLSLKVAIYRGGKKRRFPSNIEFSGKIIFSNKYFTINKIVSVN